MALLGTGQVLLIVERVTRVAESYDMALRVIIIPDDYNTRLYRATTQVILGKSILESNSNWIEIVVYVAGMHDICPQEIRVNRVASDPPWSIILKRVRWFQYNAPWWIRC